MSQGRHRASHKLDKPTNKVVRAATVAAPVMTLGAVGVGMAGATTGAAAATDVSRPGGGDTNVDRITDEDFDVFLSYAREDSALVDDLAQRLRHKAPAIRIFLDRKNINVGTAWQPEIFESLDRCRKVVALFSPDYLASKVCKEEFNIAWARSRDCDREILFPIYLFTAKLPTYMSYRAYFDCREGDAARLEGACDALLAALAPGL